jgi:hypothetical protein
MSTTASPEDRVILTGPNAWWRTHDNVVQLAYWLAENEYDGKGVAYGVEKPWKYDNEFLAAKYDLDELALSDIVDKDDDVDTLESRIIAYLAARDGVAL